MKPVVFIIDDDSWFAEALVAQLHGQYQPRYFHDAQTAIEALDHAVPAAIILDMLLPAANGLAFLHELQSYADSQAIPVIVCSSLPLSRFGAALAQYGVRHCFDKARLNLGQLQRSLGQLTAAEHAH